MATSYHFITIVLLLLTSLRSTIVARPINVAKSIGFTDDGIRDVVDILSLAAVKSDGDVNAGGKGHDQFPTALSFSDIKNSGLSPRGEGHKFTIENILGDIKNSGPSPGGKGHGYSDSESFGNIKNSGPSSGGKGH